MAAQLLIRRLNQAEEQRPLDETPLTIGSDGACNVILTDDGVLAHHAVVQMHENKRYAIAYDANGPLKTEKGPLTQLRLEDGIRFNIGTTQFEMRNGKDAAQALLDNPEQAAQELMQTISRIKEQMARIVIGQTDVVNQVLTALFARGHVLLVGTPGLAKTLMANTLAKALDLAAKRVQFTPDLMPADITGTQVLEQDPNSPNRIFKFKPGPIFTNLLLADEINRTPPKTQAALLEAMQERRITTAGTTHTLPEPFFVIATQNPIEQEGTYPLPEAQLDRFMFNVKVEYPNAEEEQHIIMETTRDRTEEVAHALSASTLIAFQSLVRQTPVSKHVGAYVTKIVRATRPDQPDSPDFIKNWVRWGAGPRAGQYLLLAAKSNALLHGRLNVSCDDVRAFVLPVLRHRVLVNFAAASEGVDSDEIVRRLIAAVPEPDYAE